LNNAYDKKSQTPERELNGNSADNDKDHAIVKGTDPPRFVAPTHGGVDIFRLLTELEDMVDNCRRVGPMMFGFSDDQFHMTLMKIRANLPEEMKRASKLARESERIVEESREQAGNLIEDARKAAMQELDTIKADSARLRDSAQKEALRLREEGQKEAQRLVEAADREAQQRQEAAQTACEQLLAETHTKAEQLISDHDIVQQAQAVAYDTQLRAEEEARAIRDGADEYAHDLLSKLETVLGKSLYQVQCGRELLEQGR
jgi:hypothetical protein